MKKLNLFFILASLTGTAVLNAVTFVYPYMLEKATFAPYASGNQEAATCHLLYTIKYAPFDCEAIEIALKNGADIMATDEQGRDVLHALLDSVDEKRTSATKKAIQEDNFTITGEISPYSFQLLLDAQTPEKQFNLEKFITSLNQKNWRYYSINQSVKEWIHNQKNGCATMAVIIFATTAFGLIR